jgi:hypothetical protein
LKTVSARTVSAKTVSVMAFTTASRRCGSVASERGEIVIGWAGMVSHRSEAMTGRENENAPSIVFSIEGNSGIDGLADLTPAWRCV